MSSELSTLVRYHRKRTGLSQSELAKLAGVGKSSVFDIEHGKLSVQWNTVMKVLRVLNIQLKLIPPPTG